MSITGYYTIRWTDSRFNWSSDPTYNSIPYMFSTSSDTWRPTLIIANAVSDVSILNDEYNIDANQSEWRGFMVPNVRNGNALRVRYNVLSIRHPEMFRDLNHLVVHVIGSCFNV